MKLETFKLLARLENLGFTAVEARTLRRCSLTLQRWYCAECNGTIQRDGGEADGGEADGKPFYHSFLTGERRGRIPDREKGALARIAAIVGSRRGLRYYIQTDPRGASLYILRRRDIRRGDDISSIYTRGVAVY
jgi:hypothetical protein